MPTYTCTTRPDFLGDSQRAAIARAITRAHSAATGAPTSFAQIVFEERANRFIGGEPTDAHVMVHGDIRSGRAPATRTKLAEVIAREVSELAGVAAHEVWVYLNELAPGDMIEFGHVLPPAGEEDAWLAALPTDLRKALLALAERGAKG